MRYQQPGILSTVFGAVRSNKQGAMERSDCYELNTQFNRQQLDPPTNKSVSVMTATRSSNKQVSVSYDSN